MHNHCRFFLSESQLHIQTEPRGVFPEYELKVHRKHFGELEKHSVRATVTRRSCFAPLVAHHL
jgi:hypothetical protein